MDTQIAVLQQARFYQKAFEKQKAKFAKFRARFNREVVSVGTQTLPDDIEPTTTTTMDTEMTAETSAPSPAAPLPLPPVTTLDSSLDSSLASTLPSNAHDVTSPVQELTKYPSFEDLSECEEDVSILDGYLKAITFTKVRFVEF